MRGAEPDAVLVLGLGNVLCCDDGLGVAAVELLRATREIPAGVTVLDGGTLGLSLLGPLVEAPRVVLVDAVRADAAPGTIVRLSGSDVAPAVRERLSVHQVGVADLLDGARLLGASPDEVVLLGVVPARTDLSIERSAEVEAALPQLVEELAAELARMGHPLPRRARPAPTRAPWAVRAPS